MNYTTDKELKYKKFFLLLSIFALLVNIKSIFTDYNIDSGYAIATSYRQLLGDQMIIDMWEPHQTSAFLCTFLIYIYTTITHTTTGIVLFLHIMGVLIKAGLTWLIYHTLKPFINYVPLAMMCVFFFAVTPKGMILPEFSNMQLWFSVCLFCCLIKYFQETKGKIYLFCSGLFLCLEIISYPSCIIVYFGVIALLFLYSSSKWTDIALISGECLFIALSYIGYFIFKMGWSDFIFNCQYIIMGDESHSNGFLTKFFGYGSELLYYLSIFFVITIIAFILAKITSKNTFHIFFALVFICDFLKTLTATTSYFERFPIYIPMLIFSVILRKMCNTIEKQIYTIGLTLSCLSFISTLLLTNLSLAGSFNYLILAVMVSFVPIAKYLETHYSFIPKLTYYIALFIFMALTLFHCGYITKCMGGQKTNIFNIGGVVKSGPALGIFSEYMGPYIMNTTINEWQEFVNPNDRVLIVSAETLDPIMYLYVEDIIISCDSTICTPTYSEKLLKYWKLHPEKLPNIVAVECWYGDIHINEDSWIMSWITNEFGNENYIDGTYWRYYYR